MPTQKPTTMLDCKTIQTQLSEYVDGTLSPPRAWEIKLHTASCAVCDQIVRDFRQTAHLLGDLEQKTPSLDFEAALARRIADRVLAPRPTTLWETVRGPFMTAAPLSQRLGRRTLYKTVRGPFMTAAPLPAARFFRPVYLAPAVFAALVPLIYFAAAPKTAPQNRLAVQAVPAETITKEAAGESTLDELLNDHAAYASSEPLADPAGMLAAQSGTVGGAQ